MTPAIIKRMSMFEMLELILKQQGGALAGGLIIGASGVWAFVVVPLRKSAEAAIEKYNNRLIEDAEYWKSIVIEQAKK